MIWLQRKHYDLDILDDSFLSSEIDNPLDESFKVDDLETSDDDDESQDDDNKRISSLCKFVDQSKGNFARGNINVC